MSANMPKPFQGFYGENRQGARGEDFYGYVNPQPVRLVGAGEREIFNEEQINRRSGARDSGISPTRKRTTSATGNDIGGR